MDFYSILIAVPYMIHYGFALDICFFHVLDDLVDTVYVESGQWKMKILPGK